MRVAADEGCSRLGLQQMRIAVDEGSCNESFCR